MIGLGVYPIVAAPAATLPPLPLAPALPIATGVVVLIAGVVLASVAPLEVAHHAT